jgi:uncharacterized membrane protein YqjE
MTHEMLTEDKSSSNRLKIYAIINILSLMYILIFVLTVIEISVITLLIIVMSIIQIGTIIRVQRTLLNSALLILINLIGFVCWQLYRKYVDEKY